MNHVWLPDICLDRRCFLYLSFSAEFKPKKIKTEDIKSEKKAKKRKPEDEVCVDAIGSLSSKVIIFLFQNNNRDVVMLSP